MSDTILLTPYRDGHHELLGTLRELIEGLDRPEQGLDEESLRAVLAFLRQGLIPFARREERALAPDGDVWECTAFEHAFLEAEIDRLSKEATAFVQSKDRGADGGAPSAVRVRRTLCRIEAVLELHVLREDDRGDPVPEARSEPRPTPSTSPGSMDPDEVARFLRSHRWGVLSTAGSGQPYGVPVSYGFNGRSVFIATGPGRKTANLEGNRAVCLTVPEIEDGERWRCAVVSGEAEWLESVADRMPAVWSLVGRGTRKIGFDRKEWARLSAARLLRIDPVEVTGRQRGY